MQLDALTLAAVADELRAEEIGARVEDVFAPAPDAIALQLYGGGRNCWLLASAHPQLARVHLLERKPRKLVAEPPAFVMLLRKHLEGARVVEVHQPPAERMLELGFRSRAEDEPVWLVLELMGRLSNIILRAADGTILGVLHPVSAQVNAYRALLPNARYLPPPPQTRVLRGESVPRLNARTVTGEALREAAEDLLAQAQDSGAEARAREKRGRGHRRHRHEASVRALLTGAVAGLGTDAAEEVAFRALGIVDAALDRGNEVPPHGTDRGTEVPGHSEGLKSGERATGEHRTSVPGERAPALKSRGGQPDWDTLAAAARELAAQAEAGAWEPTLVYAPGDDAASAQPIAFAMYRPRRFAGASLRTVESVSAMLAAYYADAEWRAGVEVGKAALAHALRTQIERCRRKDGVLHEEVHALDDAARLRLEADTLLAFQTEVPEHAATWRVQNPFGAPGEELEIALDPRLSAVENANARYRRYHKLQRAAAQIPPQIEANATELARLEQLATDLALAETPAEVAQVRAVIAEAGYLGRGASAAGGVGALGKRPSSKGGKGAKGKPDGGKAPKAQRRAEPGGAPSTFTAASGMSILVGKNSRQNETVTFREARPNDTWLHARGVPGAHVIIRNGGRAVDEATLREAAELAAYFSQARAAGSVPVDHTEVRYVRHMKGGGPGMVVYERERTLHVAPRAPGGS